MEYIGNLDWKNLADIHIDLRKIPNDGVKIPRENCIIHFHTEFAGNIFWELNEIYKENPSLKYILISSDSDCGVCYQEEHPVAEDFKKAVYMVNVESMGYDDLHIKTRCHKDQCELSDKYSIKMYAFTYWTFSDLPPNVLKWYATNNNTDDPRIISIPFGVPTWFEEHAAKYYVDHFDKSKINNRIHVAFQANTTERYEIINRLETSESYLVRRQVVSHKQYVDDLLECGLSLSPHGNGWDCYRNLEAIYLGRVPIMNRSRINMAYKRLPFTIMGQGLGNLPDWINYENSYADMNYWRQQINLDRAFSL